MDNAVGSREVMSCVVVSKKHQILKLTSDEFAILLGSMLGDGYITKKGRIQIEQSKRQGEYIQWKYSNLKRILSTNLLSATRKRVPDIITYSYRFWTKQYFHSWRELFYPAGIKIIPAGIISLLSPLALAVWFMDDGFLRKKDAVGIATETFSEKELTELVQEFFRQYGMKVSVVKRRRLYFGRKATQQFIKIISPYIIPAMRYKLP